MATRIRIPSAISCAFKSDEIFTTPRNWAFNLAIFRIVFLLFGAMPLALEFLRWTHTILPGVAPDMWILFSFYRFLPISLLGNVALGRALAVADIVLILFGIVGYRTRSSLALATLISLYEFGLAGTLGHMDHHHHVIWFMALLAAGPSGRLFSVDALILAKRNADRDEIESSFRGPAALWTLRYIWLLMGLVYLGPGIAKLQSSLTDSWASSVNLRTIMWQRWLQLYWYDPHWGKLVRADSLPAWVLTTLGAGVVAFEIGFIFAVSFRRLRPYLALWGMAFHISNALVLKIWFGTLAAAYVGLIDWTAVWRFVSRRARTSLPVFYDQGWVADPRHCSLPPKAIQRATKSRNESVLVHALGVLLFACQLGISSLMLAYNLEYAFLTKLPQHRILLRLVESLGERKPVWPFDLYPTFTPAVPPTVQVWEVRWVLPSGQEVRVSPRAYNNVFGTSNATWNVTTYEMLRTASAEQDEERSLNLAHLLWQREDPSIQRNVMAVNIYRSDYRLQAPAPQFPAELVAQTCLYAFPLSRIE